MRQPTGRNSVMLASILALAGCSGIQSALNPQGPAAGELARLIIFFTALCALVWVAVMAVLVTVPRRGKERELGASVMHLALTSMHTALLGVLLLLSPRLWYSPNLGISELWGLTPLEDQQLAGLVMWVPAGLVYGGAAVAVAGIWITASSRPGFKSVHA